MAVFTEISEEDLRDLLSRYDIGKLVSYQGISDGVQNTNYLVETELDKFILTLFEDDWIINDLPFFFDFTEHLSKADVPCPVPIYSEAGSIFNTMSGRQSAIVSFLPGKWPRAVKNHHCAEIGKYSALMHKVAGGFAGKRDNPQGDLLRMYNLLQNQGVDFTSFKPGINNEIEKSAEYIQSNWPRDLPNGVVHGDIFQDNTLFEGEKLTGIIDFYMSHNDFYVADLANTLTQWCFEDKAEFNITKARAMLSAYNETRPLSSEELNALPILASAAAMKWFLTRLHRWFNPDGGAVILNPKDPLEQLEKLRFHLQIKSVSEYGLDL